MNAFSGDAAYLDGYASMEHTIRMGLTTLRILKGGVIPGARFDAALWDDWYRGRIDAALDAVGC